MDIMSLKMLMAHHIQITLIMISWKRFQICDSKEKIHNEVESDIIWCNLTITYVVI